MYGTVMRLNDNARALRAILEEGGGVAEALRATIPRRALHAHKSGAEPKLRYAVQYHALAALPYIGWLPKPRAKKAAKKEGAS